MNTQLVLHAGAKNATLEQIAEVKLPQATETFVPIPHIEVINLFKRELTEQNLSITDEQYGLYKDGARMFGVIQLGNPESDYAVALGIRNSNDKSFPAAGAMGSRVFVCDNLAFSAEVTFARKHTKNILIDLPQVINRGVAKLLTMRAGQAQRINAYKNTELSDKDAHDLLIKALDARVLPVTRIPDVVAEWRKPSHDDFKPRTFWSLFNDFTEVLKGNLQELPRRTQALHGLMDKAVGFEVIEARVVQGDDSDLVDADFEVMPA